VEALADFSGRNGYREEARKSVWRRFEETKPETRLFRRILIILETWKGTSRMSEDRRSRPALYSQIDVGQGPYVPPVAAAAGMNQEVVLLLREMLSAQDRQNELLEELVAQMNSNQRQRATELGQWKQANPGLARDCRKAAEALGKVQTEYLATLTQEITDNYESLRDGEFMLNEFVDRFGPRLAHLNGLLQVLSQLSATTNPAGSPQTP
jgi:hypothetical protein